MSERKVVGQPSYPELALGVASNSASDGAAPWKIAGPDQIWLHREFRADFEEQVKDADAFNSWEPLIRRLFRHVGTLAAVIAEARQHDVEKPTESVTRQDLVVAAALVQVLICYRGGGDPFLTTLAGGTESLGKICKQVSFLAPQGKPIEAISALLADWGLTGR